MDSHISLEERIEKVHRETGYHKEAIKRILKSDFQHRLRRGFPFEIMPVIGQPPKKYAIQRERYRASDGPKNNH